MDDPTGTVEMAAPPRVTAIIIFLDGAGFIAQAIDSILGAQAGVSLELLLVDDGSTDGATDIAARYADADPGRVRLLSHPGCANRGMAASRNLGLSHARGEFIAFLDCDDLWLPGKLAQQLAIFDADPSLGMVYGRTLIWHSWDATQAHAEDHFVPLGVEPDRRYESGALLANLLCNRFQTPTTCNALLARRACTAIGGFDDAFRGLYEDQAFFARLELRYPVFVADACWAWYRQHLRPTPPFRRSSYFKDRRALVEHVYRDSRPHWVSLDARTREVLRIERFNARYPVLAAWMGPSREDDLRHRLALARAAGPRWRRGERDPAQGLPGDPPS